jgi:hypothetical protein
MALVVQSSEGGKFYAVWFSTPENRNNGVWECDLLSCLN